MIIEYIPFGRENAITRRRLCHLTGLKDRDVRGQIQKEAEKDPILSRSDGRGYYRPTLQDKEGELISYDPLNEEIEVRLIEDEAERENAETVGYYAMFEYINGFRKTLYWSKAKMEAHAEKYSMGYRAHEGFTFWEKDFDGMAYKTMLRQLISKWGIMSIDMMSALDSDMAVIRADGSKEYVDNEDVIEADSAVESKNAAKTQQDTERQQDIAADTVPDGPF